MITRTGILLTFYSIAHRVSGNCPESYIYVYVYFMLIPWLLVTEASLHVYVPSEI